MIRVAREAAPRRVERADVVILGAGLAGTSLALRLAEPAFADLRVVVVEPRLDPPHDRTWCRWPTGGLDEGRDDGGPAGESDAEWRVLEVVGATGERVRVSLPAPYRCLRAETWFDRVLPLLEAAEHVEMRRGLSADEVTESRGRVRVSCGGLPGGTTIFEAPLVFDSRPDREAAVRRAAGRGALVQSFVGWEVETEDAVFDPSCATLMDFSHRPAVDFGREHLDGTHFDGMHFVYVLPFDPRRALVESTWIAPRPVDPAVDEAVLCDWLARRSGAGDGAGDAWRRLRVERGVLPMDPRLQPPGGARRVVPLGIRGGALRPSSGYAFTRIQRASRRLADRLSARLESGASRERVLAPIAPPRLDSAVDRWMDRVFLAHLARRPEAGPELFRRLFARCPPERLIRFMAGEAGWRDRLAVVGALPAAPLAGEALKGALGVV